MAFEKGKSGNPTGRPKENAEIKALAQEKSVEAFNKIVSLLYSEDDKIALSAAKEIIDRGYGKAAQSIDVSDSDGTIAAAILQFVKKDVKE